MESGLLQIKHLEVDMWFKKELTMEEVLQFLKDNAEKIDNKTAEKLMVIIARSGANQVTHFRIEE